MKKKKALHKIIPVPYYKQKTNYTCGPSSIKMVLGFFGIRESERKLAREARTDKKSGTDHHSLIELSRKKGFYCYIQEKSSIHIIKHFISQELPVIINYVEPSSNDGHYAVVVGYRKGGIIMNDPINGKNFYLNYKELYGRWSGGKYNKSKRWIMVISKKPVIRGKQYGPVR